MRPPLGFAAARVAPQPLHVHTWTRFCTARPRAGQGRTAPGRWHPTGSTCVSPSAVLVAIKILEADFAPTSLSRLCFFRRSKSKEQVGLWGGSSSTEKLVHGIWLPLLTWDTVTSSLRGHLAETVVSSPGAAHRPNRALPASQIDGVGIGGK